MRGYRQHGFYHPRQTLQLGRVRFSTVQREVQPWDYNSGHSGGGL